MEHLDANTTLLTPAALARVQDLQAEITKAYVDCVQSAPGPGAATGHLASIP